MVGGELGSEGIDVGIDVGNEVVGIGVGNTVGLELGNGFDRYTVEVASPAIPITNEYILRVNNLLPNEIAISVETDPLLLTRWKNEGTKPVLIPRTYYEKAKDYLAIQKTKVNPDYEEYPIEIPKKYKSDLPDVAYENILKGAFPLAHFAHSIYNKYVSRPEIYRQSLITNLQQQATAAQGRLQRVTERVTRGLPRSQSASPRSLANLEQAIQRPFTAIEQNVLNPTILDTTKRAIRQMIRNPSDAFYDVLGHPLLGYAVANYAGGYLSRRASNSHAIENLPLTLRVNTKYIQQ
jgi:hypothetical protein